MMRKSIVLAIAIIVVLSFTFAASLYYGVMENKNSHNLPGPYLDLYVYGYNGSSRSPIKDNLTADVSVWIPSRYGEGETMNLFDSSVKWNQNISLGSNFSYVTNEWKSYMKGTYGGRPTMSLIVTYTEINGSDLDVYEYYNNIAFNPYSPNLSSDVFISNFTIDTTYPLATIPLINNTTSSPGIPPHGVIGPGPCPPGNSQIVWGTPHKEVGWFPIYLINATQEPSNEELVLSWTTASFSAKFEFGGVTSTNSNFLSSASGYETPNLAFNTASYGVAGNSGMYDAIFLPNTTMTWTFGTEYFYEKYGSYCELIGKASVSNLKVEYSNTTSTYVGGFKYSTAQAANGTTYGNATFDNEWARAAAYAFSNEYTQKAYNFTITAGKNISINYFDIQSSSNFNSIVTTIQDEGAIALGIATAGLIFAIMGAAASAFPGGSTSAILADISAIASLGGWIDSVVNLATSFILAVNVTGDLQTMNAVNQVYYTGNPTSPIDVTMYDTGGSTSFDTSNGTVSYLARTPYAVVTS